MQDAITNSSENLVTFRQAPNGAGLVIYDFLDPDNEAITWKYIFPYDLPTIQKKVLDVDTAVT